MLVWPRNGVALHRHGALAADSGLAGISGVTFVAPGDFDNDALTDLCILARPGHCCIAT